MALRIRLAEACSRENLRREAVSEFTVAAKLLWKDGRHEDFVKVAERLLWHDPDNLQVNKQVAIVYLQLDQTERLIAAVSAVHLSAQWRRGRRTPPRYPVEGQRYSEGWIFARGTVNETGNSSVVSPKAWPAFRTRTFAASTSPLNLPSSQRRVGSSGR